jgi:hypothetical protein
MTSKTTVVPILLYESDVWVLRGDESRLLSPEITTLRSVKGCIRSNRTKNEHTTQFSNMFKIRNKFQYFQPKIGWKSEQYQERDYEKQIYWLNI